MSGKQLLGKVDNTSLLLPLFVVVVVVVVVGVLTAVSFFLTLFVVVVVVVVVVSMPFSTILFSIEVCLISFIIKVFR